MAMLSEIKTKCEKCQVPIAVYSGFENFALVDRGRILPLCQGCSDLIRRFINTVSNKKEAK